MLLLNEKQSVHFINCMLNQEASNRWMGQLANQYKFPFLSFNGFLLQSFISMWRWNRVQRNKNKDSESGSPLWLCGIYFFLADRDFTFPHKHCSFCSFLCIWFSSSVTILALVQNWNTIHMQGRYILYSLHHNKEEENFHHGLQDLQINTKVNVAILLQ
jgi:uncharacterized membrane protein